MERKRIVWIDIARAIGILLIVAGHTLFTYQFSYLARAIFAVHVPIFFILSGYLYRQRPIKQQAKRLCVSLLLPYLFTVAVIIIGSFLKNSTALSAIGGVKSLGTNRASLVAGIYGIGTPTQLAWLNHYSVASIGAIWFLLAMFIGHLLFALMQVKLPEKRFKLVIMWGLSIVLVYFSTKTQFGLLPWSFNAGLMSVIFYTFGYTAQQFHFFDSLPLWALVIGLFFWGLSIKSGFFYMNTAYADNLPLAILGAFGGSVALCWLAQQLARLTASKVLISLGRYSLIVLCFHVIDLDLLTIASHVYDQLLRLGGPVLATIGAISYRIIFVLFFVYLVPKIPFVRSFFLNKQFPFKSRLKNNQKSELSS